MTLISPATTAECPGTEVLLLSKLRLDRPVFGPFPARPVAARGSVTLKFCTHRPDGPRRRTQMGTKGSTGVTATAPGRTTVRSRSNTTTEQREIEQCEQGMRTRKGVDRRRVRACAAAGAGGAAPGELKAARAAVVGLRARARAQLMASQAGTAAVSAAGGASF